MKTKNLLFVILTLCALNFSCTSEELDQDIPEVTATGDDTSEEIDDKKYEKGKS